MVHFLCEWDLDEDLYYLDEFGTIKFRQSDFLNQSSDCRTWLAEINRPIPDEFKGVITNSDSDSDSNIDLSDFTLEVGDQVLYISMLI